MDKVGKRIQLMQRLSELQQAHLSWPPEQELRRIPMLETQPDY